MNNINTHICRSLTKHKQNNRVITKPKPLVNVYSVSVLLLYSGSLLQYFGIIGVGSKRLSARLISKSQEIETQSKKYYTK